jgi:ATP-dependent helicase/nuclease subunit A
LGTLAQLIEKIFYLTRIDNIYSAMDGGDVRAANLNTFYTLASDYESGVRHDLEQFLEHLDAMEEKGLVAAAEQSSAGAVTIMSIHKSKGLEFPVVFVCGLAREFNRESARAQVLCDQDLGLGLPVVDAHNRLRYPTLAKRAIAQKVTSDALSEEMRVLYVALTRARDRLIMTYASQNLQKDLEEIAARMDMTQPELLTMDALCPGHWVLMTAMKRTEAGELFRLGGRPAETKLGDPVWKIGVVTADTQQTHAKIHEESDVALPEGTAARLRRSLGFRYDHTAAVSAPSKQTATQRKGREKDAEAAENAREPITEKRSWRRASFLQQNGAGKDRGNAMHAVMQYLNYWDCEDVNAIAAQVSWLTQEHFITESQAELVDCQKIAEFFATELGVRLRQGKEVLREFKFSILDPGENYDPTLKNEQILLQGVVDCALIEEDGITVVDFKTDFVTEETLESKMRHYCPQVTAYADAMARIYEKPIKEAVLYFFHTGQLVHVVP